VVFYIIYEKVAILMPIISGYAGHYVLSYSTIVIIELNFSSI